MVSLDAIFLIAKAAETFVAEFSKESMKVSNNRMKMREQQGETLSETDETNDLKQTNVIKSTDPVENTSSSTAIVEENEEQWLRYDDVYNALQIQKDCGKDWSFLDRILGKPPYGNYLDEEHFY